MILEAVDFALIKRTYRERYESLGEKLTRANCDAMYSLHGVFAPCADTLFPGQQLRFSIITLSDCRVAGMAYSYIG